MNYSLQYFISMIETELKYTIYFASLQILYRIEVGYGSKAGGAAAHVCGEGT
jgi:hypothetical protein